MVVFLLHLYLGTESNALDNSSSVDESESEGQPIVEDGGVFRLLGSLAVCLDFILSYRLSGDAYILGEISRFNPSKAHDDLDLPLFPDTELPEGDFNSSELLINPAFKGESLLTGERLLLSSLFAMPSFNFLFFNASALSLANPTCPGNDNRPLGGEKLEEDSGLLSFRGDKFKEWCPLIGDKFTKSGFFDGDKFTECCLFPDNKFIEWCFLIGDKSTDGFLLYNPADVALLSNTGLKI